MTRLVIDSSMLQSAGLRSWLAASDGHIAVLPDFVWLETYKQGTLASVNAALSVIGERPDQVLVLRSCHEIAGIDPRSADLASTIALHDSAEGVRGTVAAIRQAQSGEAGVTAQLEEHWRNAAVSFDGMLEGVADIVTALPEMEALFTPAEARRMRTGEPMTSRTLGKVLDLAAGLHEELAAAREVPTCPSTAAYLYRQALAVVVYLVWWIRSGSQPPRRLDRARNDFIDLGLAVCATYFDGLMTADAKAAWMHRELRGVLGALDRNRSRGPPS